MHYHDAVTEDEHAQFVDIQQESAKEEGLITCVCDSEISLYEAYRCLYCGIWWCEPCAEEHFGQTISEYHSNKRK